AGLAVALRREVRDLTKRIPLRALGQRFEARQRAVAELRGTPTGTLEAARLPDRLHQLTRVGGGLPRRQETRSGSRSKLVESVDHRQRQHAALEILPHVLAEGLVVAVEIEDVVGDLEGKTEVRAERAQHRDALRLRLREHRRPLT